MRKEVFIESEYYHIYGRGVDKRPVFNNDRDRARFVHTLYILNNFQEIPYRFDVVGLEPKKHLVPIKPYVKIAAGCLMSNHYHLLMSPLRDSGISELMHKVGTSYTKYFNIRHERSGRLFESTFKAKHVDSHEYATYLTQYIHLNPVELFQAKLGTKLETGEVLSRIEGYEWSSLPDYLGKSSKFSIMLSSSFQKDVLGLSPKEYKDLLVELFQA